MKIYYLIIVFIFNFSITNAQDFKLIKITDGLKSPWSLSFINQNEALITEKSGNIIYIDIQKTEESLKLHALNFKIAKEKSLSELNSYKEIVALNVSQIKLAKQTVREEQKLYNKGRGNLTFVLQAQDNAHESEIRYVRNQIFLHLLSYRYYALTDQLLVLFNKSDS